MTETPLKLLTNLEINLSQSLLTYTFTGIARAQTCWVSTDHLLLTGDYFKHFTVTGPFNSGNKTLNSNQFRDGETEAPRDTVIFQRSKVYNKDIT